ncbi:MAG: hypothetical protein OEM52_11075 [bacterium]|nr:hypothetical protein [bacterium]
MGWRKPEIPRDADFDGKEEDWNGRSFYWLSVTSVFGKPIGLEDAYSKIIMAPSKEGIQLLLNPRVLFQPGAFSSKVMIEIERPDNYSAQVVTTDTGKVFSSEAIGEASQIKKVVDRMTQKVTNDGYVVQGVYHWYLTDAPWSLNKASRTVVFIRI